MLSSSSSVTAMISVVLMAAAITTANGQAQTCASKLVPCGQYLNSTTKPPDTCCDPIKEAVATDLQCLCNLYKNPGFLTSIGINITQALRLPQLCGISSDASACDTPASSPSGSNTRPPPAGSSPGGNGAGMIASSGTVGLFLVSASMMLF